MLNTCLVDCCVALHKLIFLMVILGALWTLCSDDIPWVYCINKWCQCRSSTDAVASAACCIHHHMSSGRLHWGLLSWSSNDSTVTQYKSTVVYSSHGRLLVLRLKAALVLLFHRGPHVISSVARMGTLLFLAECHKSWLSQGFIVLRCLSYGKFLCLFHRKPSVPEASCFWLCLSVNAFVSLCIPQTLLTPCLGNQWREFHAVLVTDGFVDVLISFWGQTV